MWVVSKLLQKGIMLILQNVSYTHPNKDLLFSDIHLTVGRQQKIALIGNNGSGKSTLLKIIAGVLQPSSGTVAADTQPYYIPQLFGQFNNYTIAQALRIESKLKALKDILKGNVTDTNLALLNDDWTIEERCEKALSYWNLEGFDLTQKMSLLSGGQKTKVFLAGIIIHQPEIVLMDEPSNHLDVYSRQLLYDLIQTSTATLLIVSHDRKLLHLVGSVYELSKHGISVYGGDYEFYLEQKKSEQNALLQDVKSHEKDLRKAKEVKREAIERQQKLNARGRKKQEKAGLPTILMNTLKNSGEKSFSQLKNVHTEKIESISEELNQLRKELPDVDKMKLGFDNSTLHTGKILINARNIEFGYNSQSLWDQPLSFLITSGDRIAIKGMNGSGKTTLIKIILGEIEPCTGSIQRADMKIIYIDQDYSIIQNNISIYEQAQMFNYTGLQEHEVKIYLTRFLFFMDDWDKNGSALSGGEKMRLILCCLSISRQAPDIIILDEPTNNLDIQNIEILTTAISDYNGTLIVISHDEYFLEQIHITRSINLREK